MKITKQIAAEITIILDDDGLCSGDCGLFDGEFEACRLPYLRDSIPGMEELKYSNCAYKRCEECIKLFGEVNHEI